MQYVKDLRILAEQFGRQVPMDESFTLVSGTAEIHQDDPQFSKQQYFSSLKQQELELKKKYAIEKDFRQR